MSLILYSSQIYNRKKITSNFLGQNHSKKISRSVSSWQLRVMNMKRYRCLLIQKKLQRRNSMCLNIKKIKVQTYTLNYPYLSKAIRKISLLKIVSQSRFNSISKNKRRCCLSSIQEYMISQIYKWKTKNKNRFLTYL